MARPPYCSIGAGYGAVLPEGMEPGVAPMQGSLGPCNDQPMAETVLIVDDHALSGRWPGRCCNYWAVLVAAATSVVTSALYYVVFGDAWLTLRGLDPSTPMSHHSHGRWSASSGTTWSSPLRWPMCWPVWRSEPGRMPCGWGCWSGLGSRPWPWPVRCCTRTIRWGCI